MGLTRKRSWSHCEKELEGLNPHAFQEEMGIKVVGQVGMAIEDGNIPLTPDLFLVAWRAGSRIGRFKSLPSFQLDATPLIDAFFPMMKLNLRFSRYGVLKVPYSIGGWLTKLEPQRMFWIDDCGLGLPNYRSGKAGNPMLEVSSILYFV